MPGPLIPLAHLTEPAQPERKYRLMEVVRRTARERRYGRRTEQAYVAWIRRYIVFNGRRHPGDLDLGDVRAFLSDLAVRQRVSASTQNQALAAINFLYEGVLRRPLPAVEGIVPATTPRRLPVVLTPHEVRTILNLLRGPERLVVSLLYGSGLRILECVSLRVKDVDLERCEITVRRGKGDKDRRAPLAESAIADLRRCDSSGVVRRHHLHETQVQRAVREAAIEAKIGKRVSCHTFRHSFATHLLESGSDIRTIQELLGHADVRTTMVYTHVLNRGGLGVQSPADRL